MKFYFYITIFLFLSCSSLTQQKVRINENYFIKFYFPKKCEVSNIGDIYYAACNDTNKIYVNLRYFQPIDEYLSHSGVSNNGYIDDFNFPNVGMWETEIQKGKNTKLKNWKNITYFPLVQYGYINVSDIDRPIFDSIITMVKILNSGE